MDKKKSYGMTTGKRIGNGVTSVILNAIMLLFSLSCIFPLVWMLYSSLMPPASAVMASLVTVIVALKLFFISGSSDEEIDFMFRALSEIM